MAFALVFPGQGSQSVGMMAGFGDSQSIRDTFTEASDALGEDLWQMVNEGPVERLALTENTQPLMLTAGVATYRAWRAAGGPQPALVAGHSLGEYSALVAAGVLAFADAVPLVRFRAQAMQHAVPVGEGAMAALLGLEVEEVRAACAEAAQGEVVDAANLNAPGQIVIAGAKAAVERAIEAAKARGAKRAMLLPVSAPFHCALMNPAAAQLGERLQTVKFARPAIDVLNNVDVAVYDDPEKIRDALVRQAFSPVRWIESVNAIVARGLVNVIECGPGKVLSGMTRRINKDAQGGSIHDAASLEQMIATVGAI
ncbi:malonyl CoA-acyl carrier protein transacylase [Betaproteobacteria bacterium]|nr:malonyl CoA-acyl carrier protein transacylase [Betaproteobacteria bacterium]GHT94134.1 malonyl CoA-acyl carrier protein transacylase [Betaproteobacteria bacterium]GHT99074.1 malonyl CoA-acyl carrier protein transacylase [Betaproteobacteria bacterium]GHU00070.1 malonyl CoA-acyl carrier protein transacylase [Betaproteobacteria bacterium]GHU07694.1 malonyl CoA-acyl carrier protein transacylase [Betaproteobacteria bacterium]